VVGKKRRIRIARRFQCLLFIVRKKFLLASSSKLGKIQIFKYSNIFEILIEIGRDSKYRSNNNTYINIYIDNNNSNNNNNNNKATQYIILNAIYPVRSLYNTRT